MSWTCPVCRNNAGKWNKYERDTAPYGSEIGKTLFWVCKNCGFITEFQKDIAEPETEENH